MGLFYPKIRHLVREKLSAIVKKQGKCENNLQLVEGTHSCERVRLET